MSGIELKKNEAHSKKQKLKLALCLICSNLLLFLLMSFYNGKEEAVAPSSFKAQILHEGHERLRLPLRLHLVYNKEDKEIPITLYTEEKKRLIAKAYLHTEESEEENFIVEIPSQELQKLVAKQGQTLDAYPLEKNLTLAKKAQVQGEAYEFHF